MKSETNLLNYDFDENKNKFGKIMQDMANLVKISENDTWFVEIDDFRDGTYTQEDLEQLNKDIVTLKLEGINDIDSIIESYDDIGDAIDYHDTVAIFYGDFKKLVLNEASIQLEAVNNLKEYGIEGDLNYRISFLDTLKEQCDDYLNNAEASIDGLYGEMVEAQVDIIENLYLSIPSENRPEWIDLDVIKQYQYDMSEKFVSSVLHEHQKPQYDKILMGDDLVGAKENAMDLEVALETGKDLDGVNIPDDTPQERLKTFDDMSIRDIKEKAQEHIKNQKQERKTQSHQINTKHNQER